MEWGVHGGPPPGVDQVRALQFLLPLFTNSITAEVIELGFMARRRYSRNGMGRRVPEEALELLH